MLQIASSTSFAIRVPAFAPYAVVERPRPPFNAGKVALRAAAAASRLTTADLIGARRSAHIVAARFALIRVLSRHGWSLPRIGRLLGNRDHTTILNGLRRSHGMMADPHFASLCGAIESAIS